MRSILIEKFVRKWGLKCLLFQTIVPLNEAEGHSDLYQAVKFTCICHHAKCNRNQFWGFPTRMVNLYYISCLRYTILVGNPCHANVPAKYQKPWFSQTICESTSVTNENVDIHLLFTGESETSPSALADNKQHSDVLYEELLWSDRWSGLFALV